MGILSSLLGNANTIHPEQAQSEFKHVLLEEEKVEIAFKLIRDTFIFTSKRLILIDKQGLTGSKVSTLSIPYKSISRFSVENAGHFDLDAELKIWISSEKEASISKKFNSKVNVFDVQKVLANYVCK